jgi:predicted nucleotidyltransferase
LLDQARRDDNVVGVVVFGSRGKGAFVTERSDWDVFVVVREKRDDRPFVPHGRLRPYNKWLAWDLEHHPLPWNDLPRLERIARTGDLAEQATLFRDAERLARAHGFANVIDGWEPDVALLRGDA